MELIKTNELPVGFFVTDTYHQSGNKEFVSFDYKEPDKKGLTMHCDSCYKNVREFWHTINDKHVCIKCSGFKNRLFGTKHIQLVAVNPKYEFDQINSLGDFQLIFCSCIIAWPLTQEQYEFIENLHKQGKDFFIYKVDNVIEK